MHTDIDKHESGHKEHQNEQTKDIMLRAKNSHLGQTPVCTNTKQTRASTQEGMAPRPVARRLIAQNTHSKNTQNNTNQDEDRRNQLTWKYQQKKQETHTQNTQKNAHGTRIRDRT